MLLSLHRLVSLVQRVLGKPLQPPCPLGLWDPGFSLGEALWSRCSDCLNPCHTLLGCQGWGQKRLKQGKNAYMFFIRWVVLCARGSPGSQKFNYCSHGERLHAVLARLDLTGGLHEVRQIAFVALSNTSRQRLFYVKEEILWLNCSLGIFRAVTMLTKFHTFHLQDMQ